MQAECKMVAYFDNQVGTGGIGTKENLGSSTHLVMVAKIIKTFSHHKVESISSANRQERQIEILSGAGSKSIHISSLGGSAETRNKCFQSGKELG